MQSELAKARCDAQRAEAESELADLVSLSAYRSCTIHSTLYSGDYWPRHAHCYHIYNMYILE